MKEVRAFLELTSFCLLPIVVLLAAMCRRCPLPAVGTAEPVPAGRAAPASESPRAAVISASDAGEQARSAAEVSVDGTVMLTIRTGEGRERMTLREYLVGVVAAEMPAAFQPEALMAQAVAARTDTLYRMLESHPHEDADCCTDPNCCKAYASPAELRARWGADYPKWEEKIRAAVSETDGEILTYGGEPIFAAFHAASSGSTENSENVWLQALPYLRSVPTGETEADVPRFRETVSFTPDELAALLSEKCPDADLSGSPEGWLTEERRSESGRLLGLRAGGVSLSGTSLRSILGLRSTEVSWRWTGEVFCFETLGFGHGVGMSQYGAEVMARDGSTHREILLHYYSGAILGGWEQVFSA